MDFETASAGSVTDSISSVTTFIGSVTDSIGSATDSITALYIIKISTNLRVGFALLFLSSYHKIKIKTKVPIINYKSVKYLII